MSRLDQLKAQIYSIAASTDNQANQLKGVAQGIQAKTGVVSSEIGGTASGSDTKIINSFTRAQQAVDQAANALLVAASKAREWADKA